MTLDNIIRMAREAGCIPVRHPEYDNDVQVFATPDELERFAALVAAAERNKLVAWMMAQGYTYDTERDKVAEWMNYTSAKGDTTKELLAEMGWQIEQRIKGLISDMRCQVLDRVKAEREACAKVCDELHYAADAYGAQCAEAIRARGRA